MVNKKLTIKQFGEEGKVDVTLKLIRGYDCYRLVAIDSKGREVSLCQVDVGDYSVTKCEETVQGIF